MTDLIGNELSIGDKVITTVQGYEELVIGEITKFTPQKCYVELVPNPSTPSHVSFKPKLKSSYQIYKINDKEDTNNN